MKSIGKAMKVSSLVLFVALLFGCPGQNGNVIVPETFGELSAKYGVLRHLPFTTVPAGSYKNSINSKDAPRLEMFECPPFGEAPEGAVCADREYFVPVVPLHSLVAGLSLDDARAYFTEGRPLPDGISILPLSKVELPLKAIPVGGKYVNDGDYPLVGKLYLSVTLARLEPGTEPVNTDFREKLAGGVEALRKRELAEAVKAWLRKTGRAGDKLYKEGEELSWIVAVGDVMPGRGIDEILRTENGVEKVFSSTLPHLRQGAITACNFEAVLSQGKGATKKSYNFYVPEWVLPYLRQAGFNYLTLTNNHIWDFGLEGFTETLAALQEGPLAYSGAGLDLEEASVPWKTVSGTTSFTVLSVAAYPREKNGFDGRTSAAAEAGKPGILFSGKGAEEAMRRGFSAATFDIVFVHGGIESQIYPGKEYEDLYRSFVDLGADLVVGSHPHVLQRMEAYKGKLIAYSLGDFIFAEMDDVPGGEDAVILKMGVSGGRVLYVEAVPVKLSYTGVTVKSGTEALADFLSLP